MKPRPGTFDVDPPANEAWLTISRKSASRGAPADKLIFDCMGRESTMQFNVGDTEADDWYRLDSEEHNDHDLLNPPYRLPPPGC